jgi:enhancing lycopene biosynthesis protein 2
MAKKVAVVLSGCGVFDGAEIHESVVTLLALDRQGAEAVICAPDVPQMHVFNHLTGAVEEGEQRNVLVESARIARGNITNVADVNASDIDALVIPGGFGAAKNLCDFAVKGADCVVNPDVASLIREVHAAGKPIAAICIAPAVLGKVLGGEGAQVTIGTDTDTAAAIESMGATHVSCPVNEFVIDTERKLVTTPAYMLAQNISEAANGIEKTVSTLLDMI